MGDPIVLFGLDLLFNAIGPVTRFPMQMRDCHDHDGSVVLTVNNTVGKPREQASPKSRFYFNCR